MAIREDIVLDPTKGIKGLDEMDRATVKYARKQERLWRENQESIDAIGRELKTLKRLRDTANDPRSVKRYNKAISKLEKEQQELRQESERYGRTVKNSSQEAQTGFQKIGTAAKAWIAGVAVSALYALQRGLRKVINVTSDFEHSMAEVSTLVDTNAVNMEGLSDGLQDIATRVSGTNWSDLPKALYQTISAGIDAGDALKVVETSARSAVAGVTEVSVAVDGITTAINAWGMEAEDAEDVSDSFFTAVQAGKTTFDELSQSIGRAAPLAAATNTTLEELLSAVAALTTSGLDTAQAMTAVRGIFQKILKPTQQAKDAANELGIEFNQAALESEGLYGFLQNIAEAADGNTEILGRLFEDVEALNGVLSLTGGSAEKMAETLGLMEDNAGATDEAFEKMEDKFNNLHKLFQNKLNRVMVKFGNQIMPTVIQAMEDAGRTLDAWAQRGEDFQFIQHFVDEFDITGKQLGQFTGSVRNMLEDHRNRFKNLKTDLQDYIGMVEEYNRMLAEDDISEERRESILRLRDRELAKLEEERKLSEIIIQQAQEKLKHQQDDAEYQAKWNIKLQTAQKSLEYINGQMEDLNRTQQEVNNNQDEQNEGLSFDASMRGFANFQAYIDQIAMMGRQVPTAELRDMLTVVKDLDQQFQDLASGDVVGAQMKGAAQNVRAYNQALTEAHNELQSGAITQGEYERKVEQATDRFLGQVKEIYKTIKDDLTPAQEELFKDWLPNIEDAGDGAEDTKSSLSDIADMADSIINVADAFGAIGENARKSLSGISDVLRNVEKLEGKSGLSAAIPAIGVAGGVLSIASGLFGDDVSRDIINEMKSLKREIRRNTEALIEQAVVGSDISQSQIDMAREIANEIASISITGPGSFALAIPRLKDLFSQLQETGIPGLEDMTFEMFEGLVESLGGDQQAVNEAIQTIVEGSEDFEGISDILDELKGSLGQFGDSLEGAIERFNITTQLGGDSGEAFDRFIQDVIGLVGEDNEITDLLEQIAAAESPEGRKELANQLWEAFQDNPSLLGSDLTGSDLQEIIDMILGQESASGSEASGEGYSRSVQIARTITDVQANEMIMFLERIEKWTRDMAAGMGSKTAQSVNSTGGMMPSFDIQVPLPVTIVDDMPDGGGTMIDQRSRVTKQFNFNGPIDIGGDVTEQDIDDLTRQFNRKLKQSLRGSQF